MFAVDVSLDRIMSSRFILRCSRCAACRRPGGRCCRTGCNAAAVAPPGATVAATAAEAGTMLPAAPAAPDAAAGAAAAVALEVPPGTMRTDSCRVSRDCRMSGDPVPSPEGPDLLMLMAGRLSDSSALLLTPARSPEELALARPPCVPALASPAPAAATGPCGALMAPPAACGCCCCWL